jgi:hypothetical protein
VALAPLQAALKTSNVNALRSIGPHYDGRARPAKTLNG